MDRGVALAVLLGALCATTGSPNGSGDCTTHADCSGEGVCSIAGRCQCYAGYTCEHCQELCDRMWAWTEQGCTNECIAPTITASPSFGAIWPASATRTPGPVSVTPAASQSPSRSPSRTPSALDALTRACSRMAECNLLLLANKAAPCRDGDDDDSSDDGTAIGQQKQLSASPTPAGSPTASRSPSKSVVRATQPCTGCAGSSGGPCIAADNVCHSTNELGVCPSGTTACEGFNQQSRCLQCSVNTFGHCINAEGACIVVNDPLDLCPTGYTRCSTTPTNTPSTSRSPSASATTSHTALPTPSPTPSRSRTLTQCECWEARIVCTHAADPAAAVDLPAQCQQQLAAFQCAFCYDDVLDLVGPGADSDGAGGGDGGLQGDGSSSGGGTPSFLTDPAVLVGAGGAFVVVACFALGLLRRHKRGRAEADGEVEGHESEGANAKEMSVRGSPPVTGAEALPKSRVHSTPPNPNNGFPLPQSPMSLHHHHHHHDNDAGGPAPLSHPHPGDAPFPHRLPTHPQHPGHGGMPPLHASQMRSFSAPQFQGSMEESHPSGEFLPGGDAFVQNMGSGPFPHNRHPHPHHHLAGTMALPGEPWAMGHHRSFEHGLGQSPVALHGGGSHHAPGPFWGHHPQHPNVQQGGHQPIAGQGNWTS